MVSIDRQTALVAGGVGVAVVGGRLVTLGSKTGNDTGSAGNYDHSLSVSGTGQGTASVTVWTSGEQAPNNVSGDATFSENFFGGWRGEFAVPSEGSASLFFDGDIQRMAFDRGIVASVGGENINPWRHLASSADGPAFIGGGRTPPVEIAVWEPHNYRANEADGAGRHAAEHLSVALDHAGWAHRVYYGLPTVANAFNTPSLGGIIEWYERKPHGIWAKDSNVALAANGSGAISEGSAGRGVIVGAGGLDPSAPVETRVYQNPNYSQLSVLINGPGKNLNCAHFGKHGGWYTDGADGQVRYGTWYGRPSAYDAVNACGREYQAAIDQWDGAVAQWAVYTDCCGEILTSREWGWEPDLSGAAVDAPQTTQIEAAPVPR